MANNTRHKLRGDQFDWLESYVIHEDSNIMGVTKGYDSFADEPPREIQRPMHSLALPQLTRVVTLVGDDKKDHLFTPAAVAAVNAQLTNKHDESKAGLKWLSDFEVAYGALDGTRLNEPTMLFLPSRFDSNENASKAERRLRATGMPAHFFVPTHDEVRNHAVALTVYPALKGCFYAFNSLEVLPPVVDQLRVDIGVKTSLVASLQKLVSARVLCPCGAAPEVWSDGRRFTPKNVAERTPTFGERGVEFACSTCSKLLGVADEPIRVSSEGPLYLSVAALETAEGGSAPEPEALLTVEECRAHAAALWVAAPARMLQSLKINKTAILLGAASGFHGRRGTRRVPLGLLRGYHAAVAPHVRADYYNLIELYFHSSAKANNAVQNLRPHASSLVEPLGVEERLVDEAPPKRIRVEGALISPQYDGYEVSFMNSEHWFDSLNRSLELAATTEDHVYLDGRPLTIGERPGPRGMLAGELVIVRAPESDNRPPRQAPPVVPRHRKEEKRPPDKTARGWTMMAGARQSEAAYREGIVSDKKRRRGGRSKYR